MKEVGAEGIPDAYIRAVRERLEKNQRVRRAVPGWGRMHVERQLPFLFVYRRPETHPDAGTFRLVQGEAAFLRASGRPALRRSLSHLVLEAAGAMQKVFGAFLVIEIWAGEPVTPPNGAAQAVERPGFRVFDPGREELADTVDALEAALEKVRVRRRSSEVERVETRQIAPPGMPRLFSPQEGAAQSIYLLGIEIRPIYRDHDTGEVFPLVLRDLHREMGRVLRKTAFRFSRDLTTHRPPHYHSLGRRALVKSVWEVDRRLAAIADRYDFLLSVTPVNGRQAWHAFRRHRFEKPPRFLYRPMRIAPSLLKRELFSIPIERIEEPEVAEIFREKQDEIDRQLSALLDREKPRFLYSSLQIFGGVDDELETIAAEILTKIPPRSRERSAKQRVNAAAFAARASEEIRYFRQCYPETTSRVQIRDDLTGLIVSQGNLLVPADLSVAASRVEALIQHEVGTHVLTYVNGRAQPFRQLYSGLAGYDELQEGIAVLSEYLVGGLSRPRLRLLAARVIAVQRMLDGAGFVETHRELHRDHGMSHETAFTVTMRVYRGGGLTKDAAYLRGLVRLIRYLQGGGSLEPLLVGKISADHVGLVTELLRRGVLRKPPLRPRYLSDPEAAGRLEALSRDGTLIGLMLRGRNR